MVYLGSFSPGSHEGASMAMYLTRFTYTPETWARLIQNPEDRREAARAYIRVGWWKAARFLVRLR